jgi:hypothetical protein
MDLSEHVTYLLDKAVQGEEYPMEVTVTIDVDADIDRVEEGSD